MYKISIGSGRNKLDIFNYLIRISNIDDILVIGSYYIAHPHVLYNRMIESLFAASQKCEAHEVSLPY